MFGVYAFDPICKLSDVDVAKRCNWNEVERTAFGQNGQEMDLTIDLTVDRDAASRVQLNPASIDPYSRVFRLRSRIPFWLHFSSPPLGIFVMHFLHLLCYVRMLLQYVLCHRFDHFVPGTRR